MATKLTGRQKAAILLLTLGEDAAAEVLKHLGEDEIKAVSAHMAHFEEVTPADVERVCNEYYVRTEKSTLPPPIPTETKSRYLQNVLARAVGEARSEELVRGILVAPPESALEKLQWHAPRTVAQFIAREHPQVVAVVLATMDEPGLAEKVLAELPEATQQDVVRRMAALRAIPQDRITAIEETLAEAMATPATTPLKDDSGAHRVAEVLNTAPARMEKMLLGHIEAKNPELAERIRDQMLRFEDFIRMDNLGLQKVLNHSNLQDLVLALRAADEGLRGHVLTNLSQRTARRVEEEIEALGPTRVAEIEAAQHRLIAVARKLIEQGEVTLLGKPGDYVT